MARCRACGREKFTSKDPCSNPDCAHNTRGPLVSVPHRVICASKGHGFHAVAAPQKYWLGSNARYTSLKTK